MNWNTLATYILILLLSSCATSMSPLKVNSTLPALTKSTYFNQILGSEALKLGRCRVIVKDRKYNAPIGFTVKNDLKNGAKGIDEWVSLDGGNAYILTNYEWITVDSDGSTQLYIEFDTMTCD